MRGGGRARRIGTPAAAFVSGPLTHPHPALRATLSQREGRGRKEEFSQSEEEKGGVPYQR